MRLHALAPLGTALVAFRDPQPHVSLVVKRCLRLDEASGRLVPTDASPELGGAKLCFDGSAKQDDFAPRKARSEIIVVGSAHARAPSSQVAVELLLGSAIQKRGWVRSAEPSSALPLLPANVRVEAGASAWFGPRPVPELARGPARNAREAGWSTSWVELAPGESGESLQCAAAEQQTWERIGAGTPLELRGLTRQVEAISVVIPSLLPWVVLVHRGVSPQLDRQSPELRLETLRFDTATGILELVHRAELAVADVEAPSLIVFGLSEGGVPPWPDELDGMLERAGVRIQAGRHLVDVAHSPEAPRTPLGPTAVDDPPTGDDEEIATIRPPRPSSGSSKTLPPDAGDVAALPFSVRAYVPPEPEPASVPFDPAATVALPFHPSLMPPPPSAASPASQGLPFARANPTGGLPFQASALASTSPRAPEADGLPFSRRGASLPEVAPVVAHPPTSPVASPPALAVRAGDTMPPAAHQASELDSEALDTLRPPSSVAQAGPALAIPPPTVVPFVQPPAVVAPLAAPSVVPTPIAALPFSSPAAAIPRVVGVSATATHFVGAPSNAHPSGRAEARPVRPSVSTERSLEPAVLAAVRLLAPESRHEAIASLGWSPLAYASAEQHHLERVQGELAEGRHDLLRAVLSALHERALNDAAGAHAGSAG